MSSHLTALHRHLMCCEAWPVKWYVTRSRLHAQEGRWGWAIVATEAVAGAAASAGASIGEAVGELASLIRREDGEGEPGDGKPKRSANATGLLSATACWRLHVKMRHACMVCHAALGMLVLGLALPCEARQRVC